MFLDTLSSSHNAECSSGLARIPVTVCYHQGLRSNLDARPYSFIPETLIHVLVWKSHNAEEEQNGTSDC